MNLIDRHILREWLGILGVVLMATLGLLLIQTMYDDFEDLLKYQAPVTDVVMYFAIKVPSFLAVILPVILLISLLYALGQLHRSNEITALRAAGLGIFRITRSIWITGVALCGLMWALNASVVPLSVERSRSMMEYLKYRHEVAVSGTSTGAGLARVVTFDNQRQGRMWFMNRYSTMLDRGYGVTVSELDTQRREKVRMYAAEAKFERERGGWTFYQGRETWFDPATGDVISSRPFEQKAVPYFTEEPELMLVFDVKPSDLSFFQLRRIIDYFTVEENPKVTTYAVRYFSLIADTVSPLIVIALAIPFAVAGVRVNPAVGVSKSLGLFLLYFVLLKVANALGVRGTLDPLMAACVPSVAMLALGGWFSVRMR
ncbi:permease [Nibricoccus aquaticus]|uniref:Permease n=1 Tax=Nibricoccus aquaticus TaxID=2576891 RepID=A0A290Q7Q6_9BACT|nr:LptF/LptG family permease [Nibricoccus aquaticus]ATC63200.1 permease [Nibricoccus aquaticus]